MKSPSEEQWDLVVIGGGAAGFFAAITAAEQSGTAGRVIILEKSSRLLEKVRISGGGRCNVTHACFDPKTFASNYPRGEKALIGPLHRWDAQKTIDWFEGHGVELKTEADGRVFPVTNDSQTIIDCLVNTAQQLGVIIKTRMPVEMIEMEESGVNGFQVHCSKSPLLKTRNLLVATGGTRSLESAGLLDFSGHSLIPPVPSLFTFKIPGGSLRDLAGVSVKNALASIPKFQVSAKGPLLITHWGLSGPAILKLSARGARDLNSCDYRFTVHVNWLPGIQPDKRFSEMRCADGGRSLTSRSPFPEIPRRLWERLVSITGIPPATRWSQISRSQAQRLAMVLTDHSFEVSGKSMNKEEFVTSGGVELNEINLRTMESRLVPGLYFAGEVLNVDGVTGGFNFQNAWTTGYLAGAALIKN